MKATATWIMLSALTLLHAQPLVAQSSTEVFPSSMLGFLKPGTHVGVRSQGPGASSENFTLLILEVDDWKIANDARLLPLEGLRKKYPVVEALASRALAEHQESMPTRMEKLPKGKRYAEPEISISMDRSMLLYTVIHVGDDYVLLSASDSDNRRRVLPKHSIGSVYWSNGLLNLSIHSQVVDSDEMKPSVAR